MNAHDILNFWFSELTPAQWFRGGEAVDELIRSRYEPLVAEALAGDHDEWATTAEGRLALIVILDQFPRNLYREQPKAFACDAKALTLALEGISCGDDEKLGPHQRAFFYLPLEHSESMEVQDQSIERYASLVLSTPLDEREAIRHYLDYAWQHYTIIKQFGRYPHRNAIFGRASTDEEITFLQGPNSSF